MHDDGKIKVELRVKSAQKLTKNQTMVLAALVRSEVPLSAYDILDRVREQGIRSPLQVYRALGPLVEHGRVHRLETLSAFVACSQGLEGPHSHPHALMAFAICDGCGRVEEFPDSIVASRLKCLAEERKFRTNKTMVEMRGICGACSSADRTVVTS